MGNLGKLGKLADGSVFFLLIRIGFFTIVVSAIIQRAILYATVKSLYFKTPITHTNTDIASSIIKQGVYSKHFMGCSSVHACMHACMLHMGLCNWHSIILIFMSVIIAVLL